MNLRQLAPITAKNHPDFEQADVFALAIQVVTGGDGEPRPQGAPHGRHVAGDRVFQQDGLHIRLEQPAQIPIDEAVGDGLEIAAGGQASSQAAFDRRFAYRHRRRGCARWDPAGDSVVSVYARDLFNEVLLHGDIESKRGWGYLPCPAATLDLHLERLENLLDAPLIYSDPEQAFDRGRTKLDRRG